MSQESMGHSAADEPAQSVDELRLQVAELEQELRAARRRMTGSPTSSRMLEDRLAI